MYVHFAFSKRRGSNHLSSSLTRSTKGHYRTTHYSKDSPVNLVVYSVRCWLCCPGTRPPPLPCLPPSPPVALPRPPQGHCCG